MTKHELVSEVLRKEMLLVTKLRIVSLVIAAISILQFLFSVNVNEGFASIGTLKLTTLNVISVVIILTIEAVVFIKKELTKIKSSSTILYFNIYTYVQNTSFV